MSHARSTILRSKALTDEVEVNRWDLHDVGEPPVPEAPEAEAAPPKVEVSEEELEALRQEAYDEAYRRGLAEGRQLGMDEGHEQGYKAGEKEAAKVVRRMDRVLQALNEPLEQLDDEVEKQLLDLALLLTRQIVRRELRSQPGEIVALIREALQMLPLASRDVRVHLHPDDAQFVRGTLGAEEQDASWQIVEDPALSRGGCRVTSETSHIDATLERRLAILARDLLGGGREDDEAEASE